jgi:hypothetical protein
MLGALAVFGGWLCIPLSGILGLTATVFLNLDTYQGSSDPASIYGLSEESVLGAVAVVALLATIPVAASMLMRDPSPLLYAFAVAMGVLGIGLLPDDLGRTYAIAILPGAILVAAGGWLLHLDSEARVAAAAADEAATAEKAAEEAGGGVAGIEPAATAGAAPTSRPQ